MRHVVVDDVADGRNVDAARGDVGGDHDLILAGAEALERLGPFDEVLRLRSGWAFARKENLSPRFAQDDGFFIESLTRLGAASCARVTSSLVRPNKK